MNIIIHLALITTTNKTKQNNGIMARNQTTTMIAFEWKKLF